MVLINVSLVLLLLLLSGHPFSAVNQHNNAWASRREIHKAQLRYSHYKFADPMGHILGELPQHLHHSTDRPNC